MADPQISVEIHDEDELPPARVLMTLAALGAIGLKSIIEHPEFSTEIAQRSLELMAATGVLIVPVEDREQADDVLEKVAEMMGASSVPPGDLL
jgi:hypothetical protein